MRIARNSVISHSVSIVVAIILILSFGSCSGRKIECDFNQDGKISFIEQIFCTPIKQTIELTADNDAPITASGGSLITYVQSPELGDIAVLVRTPEKARYGRGAPVVVHVPPFFTPLTGFHRGMDTTRIGAIYVSLLWPGKDDPQTGARSDGIFDYGGPDCLKALRDVIRFASGQIPDTEGNYINELLEVRPLTGNVGIFAFAHAGIAATNVLAQYGEDLDRVKYFVGFENPTLDAMCSFDLGYFDEDRKAVQNPFYDPTGYSSTSLSIDYSNVGWIQNDQYPHGRIYFGVPTDMQYILPVDNVPRMWDKRYYSIALTQALVDSRTVTAQTWPRDVATLAEAQKHWPSRTTVEAYPLLRSAIPDLKVMLVFSTDDNTIPVSDKSHIHQAYDGFGETADLWVRLNPDQAYVKYVQRKFLKGPATPYNYLEILANVQPDDWANAEAMGYPYEPRLISLLVPLAAVTEMTDRTQGNDWDVDLDNVLFDSFSQ
jgi:hypothetical protein